MRIYSFYLYAVCIFVLSAALPVRAQEYGAAPTAAPVVDSGYSGYSGGANAPAAPPPALPPVFDSATAAPAPAPAPSAPSSAPASAPPAAAADETQAVDPCTDYMYSFDAYTVCQDRMAKIQRMKDAKGKRKSNYAPAAPKPAEQSAAPATEAPGAPAETTPTAPATTTPEEKPAASAEPLPNTEEKKQQ